MKTTGTLQYLTGVGFFLRRTGMSQQRAATRAHPPHPLLSRPYASQPLRPFPKKPTGERLWPPEGPMTLLSTSDPLREKEWMTAREALEIATRGGAQVLGRSDIGSLEPGKCADFFTLNLNTIDYAGALSDPVAAVVFCAPQRAHYTVVGGRLIVDKGEIATLDIEPVIEEHNHHAAALAAGTVRV